MIDDLLNRQFPIIKGPPKIGDKIYVPSINADVTSSCAWARMKKKGGAGTINNIQQTSEHGHLIFIIEYGGFGIWWESYLEPLQEELAKEYGILNKAMFVYT